MFDSSQDQGGNLLLTHYEPRAPGAPMLTGHMRGGTWHFAAGHLANGNPSQQNSLGKIIKMSYRKNRRNIKVRG
jgi:hypothetical protein